MFTLRSIMEDKEYVVVDGVAYPKGTEPLSWAEKLKQIEHKAIVDKKAIKTKGDEDVKED